jgi:hypothetical protein
MDRLRSKGAGCAMARAALSSLLAGLVLISTLPEPACLRAAFGDAMGVPSEERDPLPGDSELPEGETSTDEFGLEATAQQRAQLPFARNAIRASRIHLPASVLAASQPRPWWLIRYDSGVGRVGHFLAEGWAPACGSNRKPARRSPPFIPARRSTRVPLITRYPRPAPGRLQTAARASRIVVAD